MCQLIKLKNLSSFILIAQVAILLRIDKFLNFSKDTNIFRTLILFVWQDPSTAMKVVWVLPSAILLLFFSVSVKAEAKKYDEAIHKIKKTIAKQQTTTKDKSSLEKTRDNLEKIDQLTEESLEEIFAKAGIFLTDSELLSAEDRQGLNVSLAKFYWG